jgi:hypothetical protein
MAYLHPRGWQAPQGILKSVITGVRVGALAIRFSGPNEKDLAGEYFTAETDFGPRDGSGVPTLVHHGQELRKGLESYANVVLPPAITRKDWTGIYCETELDPNDRFQASILKLVEMGALRWSSGSAPQLFKKTADGRIMRWFPVEFSFTPTPCEPRLPRIRQLSNLN